MKVLKGILSESREYYLQVKRKIEKILSVLPKGSIKERKISGRRYYYLQYRRQKKVIQKYLGKEKPEAIIKQIKKRRVLKEGLNDIKEALKIIRRSEGRKRG